MIALALVLLQASATAAPPVPEKFSILVDPSPACGKPDDKGEIVVCGHGESAQRLPLPEDTGDPVGPAPSNPYLRPQVALENRRPCGASRDCVVGFGPPLVPMIKGAADLAKKAFAKKPDKRGRVPIDLSDPPPPAPGSKLSP